MTVQTVPAEQLEQWIGRTLPPSDWFQVDAERVKAFADATLDHQFIHLDAEKAARTPLGGCIAHGYLTLSLLTHLLSDCSILPDSVVMSINYGSDKVRYLTPVPVGSRIRACPELRAVDDRGQGQWLLKTAVTVEIEGEERPAMVAEILSLFVCRPTGQA